MLELDKAANLRYATMKILVVQDTMQMATGAKTVLGFAKHEADITLIPSKAKDAMVENNYDAIFVDFRLPEMNGLELTKFFRSTGFKGLIIGLTVDTDMFTVQQMKDAGLNAFVDKPLTIEKLKLLELDPSTTDFETKFD